LDWFHWIIYKNLDVKLTLGEEIDVHMCYKRSNVKVGGWVFGAIANVGAIDVGGVLTKLVHL
jgi:hypothetical protein